MAISNSTLLSGSTLSAAGGTTKTFTKVGETIPNGIKVTDLSVTDARVRPTITCINRPSSFNSLDNSYTKGKRTAKLVIPKLLASGKIVFPLAELRLEDHPEMTVAEIDALLTFTGQMCFDADFRNFVLYGTTD